mmetsp:Transcript_67896/g.122310  ORF Transcript_67896/g.122310 Transcript_67896/m.122310 type:complete len:255 (-) Transcript_67896:301-1065(-)
MSAGRTAPPRQTPISALPTPPAASLPRTAAPSAAAEPRPRQAAPRPQPPAPAPPRSPSQTPRGAPPPPRHQPGPDARRPQLCAPLRGLPAPPALPLPAAPPAPWRAAPRPLHAALRPRLVSGRPLRGGSGRRPCPLPHAPLLATAAPKPAGHWLAPPGASRALPGLGPLRPPRRRSGRRGALRGPRQRAAPGVRPPSAAVETPRCSAWPLPPRIGRPTCRHGPLRPGAMPQLRPAGSQGASPRSERLQNLPAKP